MNNKEPISDCKSQQELVFSKQSTGEVILASSLCELVIKYLIYLFTSVFLACTFYFLYWVPLSKKEASSSPKFMTISISAQQASLPAQTPQIANFLSSHLHNTSPLSSLASHSHEQPPAPAAQRMPRSALSPQGRTLWEEKPKTFKARERVMRKEHTSFDSPCLPVLPRRRFDKKGVRSAFPNHHYERRDLNKDKAHDLKSKELGIRLVRDIMVAYIYYCGLGQVQYNLPKLLSILSTLRAMGIIDTEVAQEKIKKGIQYAVSNMSNVESGVNMAKQVKSISSNIDTNQKEKTTMNIINRFNEGQSNLLNDIKDDPVLKNKIKGATDADFINLVSGGEGTLHRFAALKDICSVEDIDSIHRSYNKGILHPIDNLTVATRYLANWDPMYSLKTDSDSFIQDVLNKTLLFSEQKNRRLRNAATLEDSSAEVTEATRHFNQWKLFGQAISCLNKRKNEARKKVSPKDVSFWKNKTKELISESFDEAFTTLQEVGVGICETDLKYCIDQLLKEDLL